jgi:RNA polymerase sigma-70 factor (ECF subfamily)
MNLTPCQRNCVQFRKFEMQDATIIQTAEKYIQRLHPRLFRLARAVVYSDAEATTVVQGAYLKALTQWRPGTRQKELARSLEDHVFLGAMHERVRSRSQLLQLLDAAADADPGADADMANLEDERLGTTQRQLLDSVKHGEAIVDGLSDMLRVVFVMLDVIGMDVAEIASMLRIKEATVESRAQRARALVRARMEELGLQEVPDIYRVGEAHCRAVIEQVRERMAARLASGTRSQ